MTIPVRMLVLCPLTGEEVELKAKCLKAGEACQYFLHTSYRGQSQAYISCKKETTR
jgi:hypothetical protein